jgi:hypothetical protein
VSSLVPEFGLKLEIGWNVSRQVFAIQSSLKLEELPTLAAAVLSLVSSMLGTIMKVMKEGDEGAISNLCR